MKPMLTTRARTTSPYIWESSFTIFVRCWIWWCDLGEVGEGEQLCEDQGAGEADQGQGQAGESCRSSSSSSSRRRSSSSSRSSSSRYLGGVQFIHFQGFCRVSLSLFVCNLFSEEAEQEDRVGDDDDHNGEGVAEPGHVHLTFPDIPVFPGAAVGVVQQE